MKMRKRLVLSERELRRIIETVILESSETGAPDMSAKAGKLVKDLLAVNKSLAQWGMGCGVSKAEVGKVRQVSFALEFGGEIIRLDSSYSSDDTLWVVAESNDQGKEWVEEQKKLLPWGGVITRHASNCQTKKGSFVWETRQSSSKRGWGVLLYEVSLELASRDGSDGLVSDRSSVSPDALGVWGKYDLNRGDVKKTQLDVDVDTATYYGLKQLTPEDPWDDCQQGSAYNHAGEEWHESPLSKAYRKELVTIIPDLERAGLLWSLG